MGEPVTRPLALALFLLGSAAPLFAEEPPAAAPLAKGQKSGGTVACVVRIIHARSAVGDVDPGLDSLKVQLARPPLSSWKSFKLLKQYELRVGGAAPSTFIVPGEHEGSLQFKGRALGSKPRMRLRLDIRDGRAHLLSTVFVIDDGGTVLHGGIKYEDGVLVTGITCHL